MFKLNNAKVTINLFGEKKYVELPLCYFTFKKSISLMLSIGEESLKSLIFSYYNYSNSMTNYIKNENDYKLFFKACFENNTEVLNIKFASEPEDGIINNYNQNNDSKLNEIKNLKDQLTKANKIIEQQQLKVDELQNKLNDYNNTINNYQNIINQKDIELNNLKTQLNNINNNMSSSINNSVNINDIMSVNFISMDQNIHYSVGCLKTNTFAEVEEKLYKQYPQYRETNNNFLSNGTYVKRFKTIAENNIGNGLPVTLIVPN